ncbi:MAG: hypothetical protein ORO03_04155, partial [Alphaproteobacteria bacterium]|nr:hypothetical protein [Alphaproteobacteria bacterium]
AIQGRVSLNAPTVIVTRNIEVNGSNSLVTFNVGEYQNTTQNFRITAYNNSLVFNNSSFTLGTDSSGSGSFIVSGGSLTVNYRATGTVRIAIPGLSASANLLNSKKFLSATRVKLDQYPTSQTQGTRGRFLTTVTVTGGNLVVADSIAVGSLSLTTLTSGNITITAPVYAAGDLTLSAAGDLVESGSGELQQLGLGGQTSLVAGGIMTLGSKNNSFAYLGDVSSGSGTGRLTLVTRNGMAFVGRLSAAAGISLSSGGAIGFYGAMVNSGPVGGLEITSLASVNADQDSVLTVAGGQLRGSSSGGFFLEGLNQIATLGTVRNSGVGGIRLRNAQQLTLAAGSQLMGGAGGVQLVLVYQDLNLDGAVQVRGAWLRLDLGDGLRGEQQHGLRAGNFTLNAQGVDLYYFGAAPTVSGSNRSAIDIGSADYTGIVRVENPNPDPDSFPLLVDRTFQAAKAPIAATITNNGAALKDSQKFTGIKTRSSLILEANGSGSASDSAHVPANQLRYIEGSGVLIQSDQYFSNSLILVSSKGSIARPDRNDIGVVQTKVAAGIYFDSVLNFLVDSPKANLVLIDEYRDSVPRIDEVQTGIYLNSRNVASVQGDLSIIQAGRIYSTNGSAVGIVLENTVLKSGGSIQLIQSGTVTAATGLKALTVPKTMPGDFYGSPWKEPEFQTAAMGISNFRFQTGQVRDRAQDLINGMKAGQSITLVQSGQVSSAMGSAFGLRIQYQTITAGTQLRVEQNGLVLAGDRAIGMELRSSAFKASGAMIFDQFGALVQSSGLSLLGRQAVVGFSLISGNSVNLVGTAAGRVLDSALSSDQLSQKQRESLTFGGSGSKSSWVQLNSHGTDIVLSGASNLGIMAARVLINLGGYAGGVAGDQGRIISLMVSGVQVDRVFLAAPVTNGILANGLDLYYLGQVPELAIKSQSLLTLGSGSFTRLTPVVSDVTVANSGILDGAGAAVTLLGGVTADYALGFSSPSAVVLKGILATGLVTINQVSTDGAGMAKELNFIGGSQLLSTAASSFSRNLTLAAFGNNSYGDSLASVAGDRAGVWLQRSLTLAATGVGTGGQRLDANNVPIPSDSELGVFNFGAVSALAAASGEVGLAAGIRLGMNQAGEQVTTGAILLVTNYGEVTSSSGTGSAFGVLVNRMGFRTGVYLAVKNYGAVSTGLGATGSASGIGLVGFVPLPSGDSLFSNLGLQGNSPEVDANGLLRSSTVQNLGAVSASSGAARGIAVERHSLVGWNRLNLTSSAPVRSEGGSAYGLFVERSTIQANEVARNPVTLLVQGSATIETLAATARAIGIELAATRIVSRSDINLTLEEGLLLANRAEAAAVSGIDWTALGSQAEQEVHLIAGGATSNFITLKTGGYSFTLSDKGAGLLGERGFVVENALLNFDLVPKENWTRATTVNNVTSIIVPEVPRSDGRMVSNGHTLSARGLNLYYAGQMPTTGGVFVAVQLGDGNFVYNRQFGGDISVADGVVTVGREVWTGPEILSALRAYQLPDIDAGTTYDNEVLTYTDNTGTLRPYRTISEIKTYLKSPAGGGSVSFNEAVNLGLLVHYGGTPYTVPKVPDITGLIGTTQVSSTGITAAGSLTINGVTGQNYGLLAGAVIRSTNVAVTIPNSLLIWSFGTAQYRVKDAFGAVMNAAIYLNHGTTRIQVTGSKSDLTILQTGQLGNITSGDPTMQSYGIYDSSNQQGGLSAGRNLNLIQAASGSVTGYQTAGIRIVSDRLQAGGDILVAQLGVLVDTLTLGNGLVLTARGGSEVSFTAGSAGVPRQVTIQTNSRTLYLAGVNLTQAGSPSFNFDAALTRINLGSGGVIQGAAGKEALTYDPTPTLVTLNKLSFAGDAPILYYTGADPKADPLIPSLATYSGAQAYGFELGGKLSRASGTFVRVWLRNGDLSLNGDSQEWIDGSLKADGVTPVAANAASFQTGVIATGNLTLGSFTATPTVTAKRVNNGRLVAIEANQIIITGVAQFANPLRLTSRQWISQSVSGGLVASGLTLTAGETIDLSAGQNQIATLNGVRTPLGLLGRFSLSNGVSLALNGDIQVAGEVRISVGTHDLSLSSPVTIAALRTQLSGANYLSNSRLLSTTGGDLGLQFATAAAGTLTTAIDLQGSGRFLLNRFNSSKTVYLYTGLIHGSVSDSDADWRNLKDLELGGSLPTGLVASQINGIVEASGVTLGSLQN